MVKAPVGARFRAMVPSRPGPDPGPLPPKHDTPDESEVVDARLIRRLGVCGKGDYSTSVRIPSGMIPHLVPFPKITIL